MTGKTTFLGLVIVGLLVFPAAADSYSVTAPSSTIWALPGGAVSFPVSIVGTGTDGFSYADVGFQYNTGGSVLALSSTNDVTRGVLTLSWGSLAVSSSAAFTAAELSITGTQDPIFNPSGTILNATFHVTGTAGTSSAVSLVNYLNDPNFVMSGGPTINVIAAPEWRYDLAGTWSNANSWKGPVPNAAGAWAILGSAVSTSSAARTVTLDEPVTLGKLTISPTSGGSYTVSGNVTNNLKMTNTTGSATIQSPSGNNTINAPVSFTNSLGVTVGGSASGSSTRLTVSGAVTGTGSLTKEGLGLLALGSSLSMTDGGSVLVNSGSMTAMSLVGDSSAVTVGVDGTHTAMLAANYIDVDEIVVRPGSTMVLGSPNGSALAGGAAPAYASPAGALSAGPASVPEPSAVLLLTIAALCLPPLLRRRGMRR